MKVREFPHNCPFCGKYWNDLVLLTKHSALSCPKRPKESQGVRLKLTPEPQGNNLKLTPVDNSKKYKLRKFHL